MHTFAPAHRKPNPARTTRCVAPVSPLPQRHGLDAVRLRTPDDGPWATMRDHLVARLPRLPAARLDAMLREGRIVGRGGAVGPHDPSAAGVPVVPPRPARRGAGAVRRGRPAPRRRRARRGQAALPGHDPARPPRRRDRAGAAAPRAGPARAVARAPAGPGDGRRAAVRRAPRTARGVPDAVPRPPGAQDLRGRRPVRPGPDVPADGAQQDRQGARGDPRPGGARAGERRDARRAAGAPRRAGPLPAHPADRPHPPAAAAPARPRPADPRRPVLRQASGGASDPEPGRHRARRLDAPLQLLATTLEMPDPATGVDCGGSPAAAPCRRWTDPAGWAAGPPTELPIDTVSRSA